MKWPFRQREDQLVALLGKVLQQNAESQQALLETAKQVSAAAQQQGEVLGKYLDLFKPTNDVPNRRWTSAQVMEKQLRAEMAAEGYPVDGSEEEQARWLAENN